ncbi:hypothetical protein MTR67_007393, partial [Solanum verrucosum]
SNSLTSKGHNLLKQTWNRANLVALERSFQELSNHIWNYT